jgi:predicted dehydrogenase
MSERVIFMKVIQVGVGQFGYSWLEEVILLSPEVQLIGLVDKNREHLKRAAALIDDESVGYYETLEKALEELDPDFILNLTPPRVHREIIIQAIGKGFPVLSEKPIAESLSDAKLIYNEVENSGVNLMIAENYRFSKIIREAKAILDRGVLGKIDSLSIDFFRNHHMENYHKDLLHPLLLDVTIHHFDVLRYLTGVDGTEIYGHGWNPSWSWYKGVTNANIFMEMEEGIKVSYRGSLTASHSITEWLGDWVIYGSEAIMELKNSQITVTGHKGKEIMPVQETQDNRCSLLQEYVSSQKDKRRGETDIHDNIKSFYLVAGAMESMEKKKSILIRDIKI